MLPHHAVLLLLALAFAAIVVSNLILIWRERSLARSLRAARDLAAERAPARAPSAVLKA